MKNVGNLITGLKNKNVFLFLVLLDKQFSKLELTQVKIKSGCCQKHTMSC